MAGQARPSARNLGVDYTGGKARGSAGAGETRKARWKKFRARARRLKWLRGRRVLIGRVFSAGLLPGVTYDKDIWGISRHELLKLRRQGAAAYGIGGSGRSLDLAWLTTFRDRDPMYLQMAPPALPQGVVVGNRPAYSARGCHGAP